MAAREGSLPGQIIRNRYFFLCDLLVLVLAARLSFIARLDQAGMAQYRISFWVYLGIVLVVKPVIFQVFGLYRRYWRYASVGEVVNIVGANLVATVVVILFAYVIVPIFYSFAQIPRSIPFIDFLLTTACVGGTRFLVRLMGDRRIMSRLAQNSANGTSAPSSCVDCGRR